MDWPSGDAVFGRVRGSNISIWNGFRAKALRCLPATPGYNGCLCPADSELIAVSTFVKTWVLGSISGLDPCYPCAVHQGPCVCDIPPCSPCGGVSVCAECHPACGPGGGGNQETFALSNSVGLYDLEAIGFSISNGAFVADAETPYTGSSIPAFTGPDGIIFPANGGGAGQTNLQDQVGGHIWMGKYAAPDGSLLYVCIVAGVTCATVPPRTPNWTCVMQGNPVTPGLIHAFVYSPSPLPGAGAGGGCVNCSSVTPPAPPQGLGSGPCFSLSPYDVVGDICRRAGIFCGVDTSLLIDANVKPTSLVKGYLIERQTTAADALKVLMQAYFFEACESNGTIKFVPNGLAPALTIPEADLGLMGDKAKLIEQFDQAQDLPQKYSVVYQDPLYLYQQGKQEKQRSTRIVKTKQMSTIQIPMVMDPDWARQVAEKTLYLSWLERQHFDFNLGRASYLLLDPTDVINFVYQGLTLRARIIEGTIGQGYATALKTLNENEDAFLSSQQGGAPPSLTPSPTGGSTAPAPTAVTAMELFDIPLLQDSDANPVVGTGKYVAFSSTDAKNWPGAQLYSSADDASFDKEGSPETVAAVFGYAVGVLGVPSAAPWTLLPDAVNTATVMLANGTLAGDTLDNVKGGSNWFLWGDEIIGAETVVQNMDGSWTLSNLLRGLRGTEWAAGYWGDFSNGVNTHVSGELVVQISAPGIPRGGATGVVRYQDSATILGKLLYYRGVTLGQDITTADDQDFTITGADLKPYSPIKVGGAFNSFNDLVITWQRRTRIGGDEWGNELGSSFPISEESELYDVEILNAGGTAVVRTISNLTTPLAVYLEANQVTDFGSVQSSYKVNVYQKSATVGRGFKGHGVSPASNGITPVYPGSGQFYVNGT
ncbi:MAG TPA: phage tail protein [Chloroflexota bacterium]|nr:phage tail protein [Chloroflexota bacterium]